MTRRVARRVALACIVPALAGVPGPSGAARAGDQGAQIAAACASCHDDSGRSSGIPTVVGLGESTIVQAMLAYRSGQRVNQIMHVVAAALSPEEIAEAARYLAAQRPEGGP